MVVCPPESICPLHGHLCVRSVAVWPEPSPLMPRVCVYTCRSAVYCGSAVNHADTAVFVLLGYWRWSTYLRLWSKTRVMLAMTRLFAHITYGVTDRLVCGGGLRMRRADKFCCVEEHYSYANTIVSEYLCSKDTDKYCTLTACYKYCASAPCPHKKVPLNSWQ